MIDVFISHAREDRAACERLADALIRAGLVVDWSKGPDESPKEDNESSHQSAAATIVLWSPDAASSDQVRSDAMQAYRAKPRADASAQNRYVGIVVADVSIEKLPAPFNKLKTLLQPAWFQAPTGDVGDPQFVSLLMTLEALTGQTQSRVAGEEITDHDAGLKRLRAELDQARDDIARAERDLSERTAELTQLRAAAEAASAREFENARVTTSLTTELAAKAAIIAAHDQRAADMTSEIAILRAERDGLSARAVDLHSRLEQALETNTALTAELEEGRKILDDARSQNSKLSREIEDARSGLSAALRQQKTLQAQIDASDQIIREVMTQREDLIARRDRMERDAEKLTAQLGDTSRRLLETDDTRRTYEVALVERAKEIHDLEDKYSLAASELSALKPQATALADTVKTWGHVPWRAIAAGSIAAGALATYGIVLAGQVIDGWLGPQKPSVQQVQDSIPRDGSSTAALPPKSDVKVGPDTLQIVDRGASLDAEQTNSATPEDPALPPQDESGVPVSNDHVQFNPDGLPPVDADSRPPPQDLPPMQQKPRLLLKPPAPE